MKNPALCLLIFSLAFPNAAESSAEGPVPADIKEMVIQTSQAGYKFTVTLDADVNLERIRSEWGGKTFEFTPKHFGEADAVWLRFYEILATTDKSGGPQDSVILVLPFNKRFFITDKEDWDQWDVIRLHFHKGKLIRWDRAVGTDNQPGKWKLTSWGEMEGDIITDDGGVKGEISDQGEATGKENPYTSYPMPEQGSR